MESNTTYFNRYYINDISNFSATFIHKKYSLTTNHQETSHSLQDVVLLCSAANPFGLLSSGLNTWLIDGRSLQYTANDQAVVHCIAIVCLIHF